MGTTGPASTNPETGKPYGLDLPVVTIARHGPRPVHADRPSRHRPAVLRRRRLDGRHAGAAMGRALSGARLLGAADRHGLAAIPRRTSPSTRSAGRRSWPIPDWRGGRYLVERRAAVKGLAVARMAAHITYLSDSALHRNFGRKLQDRATPDVLLRRRLPDRDLSAPPGLDLRRAVRCQFLSLRDAGDGLFRSGGRLRRLARACLQRHEDPLLRRLLHLGLAVPDQRLAGDRACAERRRRFRSPSSRSRPTRGTTPSCSTCRTSSPLRPAFSTPPRREAAPAGRESKHERSSAPRRRSRRASIFCVVAEHGRAGSRGCSTSAAATARLLRLLAEDRRVDGRGIELSQQGVNDCVAKGLSVVQGDADTDLVDYPDDAFDYVILSQTLQATRNPARVLEHMLRIGRRAIVSVPEFRALADSGATRPFSGRMPVTENLAYSWYDTPNIHLCTIRDFVDLARRDRGDDRQGRRARPLRAPLHGFGRGGRGTCSANRRSFSCTATTRPATVNDERHV